MSEIKNLTEQNESAIRLPDAEKLIISTSPHIQDHETITSVMLKVLLCLAPAILASLFFFGIHALTVYIYCTASAVLFEHLWCKLLRQPTTIKDASAAVTGVILAMNMPPAVPWWLCVIGSFIAIIIAKAIFGGLGQNPFNPAAVARVALLIGFAGPMTVWYKPDLWFKTPDLLTSATPLSSAAMARGSVEQMTEVIAEHDLTSSILGYVGGSLGETCTLAVLLGGIGLICFRLIKWQIPVAMLGTAWLFTWIIHLAFPELTPGPMFHLTSGGMMIGAFFMATDMVTSPITRSGAFIFGAATGLLACIIRIWGSYPEGVSFAILIMNALVPLIDKLCYKRPFGWTSTRASTISIRRGEIK